MYNIYMSISSTSFIIYSCSLNRVYRMTTFSSTIRLLMPSRRSQSELPTNQRVASTWDAAARTVPIADTSFPLHSSSIPLPSIGGVSIAVSSLAVSSVLFRREVLLSLGPNECSSIENLLTCLDNTHSLRTRFSTSHQTLRNTTTFLADCWKEPRTQFRHLQDEQLATHPPRKSIYRLYICVIITV